MDRSHAVADPSAPLDVVVTGATGKMSRETIAAVRTQPGLRLTGLVSQSGAYATNSLVADTVPVSPSIDDLLNIAHAHVVVDFSSPVAAPAYARAALSRGVAFVSGTTGLAAADLQTIASMAESGRVGAIIAPNFAIGAVLLVHISRLASKHFDWAEIVELHHEQKADAPSGTALQTAEAMLAARGSDFHETVVHKQTLPGTRGGALGGIHLHSVRLQGLMAHQEVIFGGLGQTLTVRHDTTGRACYMPGVLLAIRYAASHPGYVYGLASMLGLEG